jgi:hypothetical protein
MINDVLKLHYMTILNLSKTPTLYHWVTRGLLRKIFSILIELSWSIVWQNLPINAFKYRLWVDAYCYNSTCHFLIMVHIFLSSVFDDNSINIEKIFLNNPLVTQWYNVGVLLKFNIVM